MFSSSGERTARILIASCDGALRSFLMRVASEKPALTVVGFIKLEEQIVTRTTVSAPEILVLDAQLLSAGNRILATLRKVLPQLMVFVYGTDRAGVTQARELGTHASDKGTTLIAHSGDKGLLDLQHALDRYLEPRTKAAPATAPPKPAGTPSSRSAVPCKSPQALVVAASTGGPMALMTFIKMLPKSFALPVAIIQHMPPSFTTMLAERLNSATDLEVVEGKAGMAFVPGRVIIGPGDFHMRLQGSTTNCRVELDQGEREHSCRPAANVLFRSAATVYGGRLLTVVLTGMGRDGFEGAQQLRELGSRIIVQDAETSTVWGMPGAIAQAGLADAVLPLTEIAGELERWI